MMTRNRLVVGFIVFVMVVVGLVLLFKKPTETIYQSGLNRPNMQLSKVTSPSNIYFYSGSAFAAYNPTNDTTKVLSPYFNLPTLTDTEWVKDGVYFKAEGFATDDQLYPAATSYNLDEELSYWWYYDFNKQTIRYIDDPANTYEVNDIQSVYNSDAVAYVVNQQIIYFSNKGRQEVYKASEQNNIASLLYVDNKKVIYQTTDSGQIVEVNLNNKQRKVLIKEEVTRPVASRDGLLIGYITNLPRGATGEAPGDLYIYSVEDNKKQKQLSKFMGVVGQADMSDLVISQTDPQTNETTGVYQYKSEDKKLIELKGVEAGDDRRIISLEAIGNTYYLTDSENLLSQYSPKKTEAPIKTSNYFKLQDDFYESGFNLNYIDEDDTYVITITANPYEANQQQALSFIQKQGVDPTLINIEWTKYDKVTLPSNRVINNPNPISNQHND